MMRVPRLHNLGARLRNKEERGAALVEFAIAIPIFFGLIAIVFDAGIGFTDSRSSSSAARSAARIGALAGEARNADFRVIEALRAQFGDGSSVQTIKIYRSDPLTNPQGLPPDPCDAASDCNEYSGSDLDTLTAASFGTANAGLPTEDCAAGSPDENWCPLGRRDPAGSFLGVYVQSESRATIGAVSPASFDIKHRAVFALYFAPESTVPTPTPVAN